MTSESTMRRKDALLEVIQRAGPVLDSDRDELFAMLRRPALQRALHQVIVESDAQSGILLAVNLEDPKARYEAAKAQGSAHGLLRAVESIIDNIPEKEDTDDDN